MISTKHIGEYSLVAKITYKSSTISGVISIVTIITNFFALFSWIYHTDILDPELYIEQQKSNSDSKPDGKTRV